MTNKVARENAAANAVVDTLSAMCGTTLRGCKFDDGSRNGMHDFTIGGGPHKIALEVSTIADGNRVGRDHRWNRLAPDQWVQVEGAVGCWIAHHDGEVEPDVAIAELQACVPELEALGVEKVTKYQWQEHAYAPEAMRPPGTEQSRTLAAVGFESLSRVADASDELLADHGGAVMVARGFTFTRPADRNLPVTFVNDQLGGRHLSDVRKLVAAEDVTARHLWLWVEVTEGMSMLRSFEAEGLPDQDLDVEGLDGVWLGRGSSAGVVDGYVWRRRIGWDGFSVPRNEDDLA